MQDSECFCYGIDAVLLAHFSTPRKNSRCMDLCTGNAVVPILMSAAFPSTQFCALELQEKAFDLARRSVEMNSLQQKINVIHGDLCDIQNFCQKNSFDAVTVNPPYMKCGEIKKNESEALTLARHETACTLQNVLGAADYLLNSDGDFFMIHRASRTDEICRELEKHSLVPKRMRFVFPNMEKSATMVLIHAKKCAKEGLLVEAPLIVYERDGVYSQEIQQIYNSYKF